MNTALRYAWIGALNLALAVTFFLLAPVEPKLSDRDAYDYVGQAPFAPNCPFSIYCYRPLAPTLVHNLPVDPDTGWRAYQVLSNAAAGSVIATVAATLSAAPLVPLLASVMAQTSYGFTFTAYDPYAADPLVFLIAALLTWCWVHDRVWPALALSTIGIFAKETVALIAIAIALAAVIGRSAFAPVATRGFGGSRMEKVAATGVGQRRAARGVSRHLARVVELGDRARILPRNWSTDRGSACGGATIPSIERKVYMLFATFGFGWVFAGAGLANRATVVARTGHRDDPADAAVARGADAGARARQRVLRGDSAGGVVRGTRAGTRQRRDWFECAGHGEGGVVVRHGCRRRAGC